MTFIYWDISKGWPGKLLIKIEAGTIMEADEIFQKQFGYYPISKSTTVTTIEKL